MSIQRSYLSKKKEMLFKLWIYDKNIYFIIKTIVDIHVIIYSL